MMTSASAPVGHEPMQLRQPTHASSRTITGRRRTFGGVDANGRRASNGQKGMHRSHPVRSLASMATIDCPMFTAATLGSSRFVRCNRLITGWCHTTTWTGVSTD